MSSIDITMTGAAGAAPTPVVLARPSLGGVCGGVSRGPVVPMERFAAQQDGAGLPTTEHLRPWARSGAGIAVDPKRSAVAVLGAHAPIAQRTTSSTPGALPPRDPVS
ncbi:MAG: hypothetical protein JWQ26_2024 [Modestobacter sp.]|nr:hypothetical protein [Modestobacter sp.]